MYDKLSRKMVVYAIDNNIIDKQDYDIYLFAYTALLSHTFTLFSMFIIGIFLGRTLQTVIFLASFYPIRVYAGGFHKNTFEHCYFTSLAIYVIVTLVENLFISNNNVLYILLAIAVFVIIKEMPQQSENKPLTEKEVAKYKKQGRLLLLLVLLMYLILVVVKVPFSFQYYTVMGIITVGCLLLMGKLKGHRK
ncbi:MAG: accessory gene regulator B family protein [Oscillospiraceae bacterium]